MGFLDGAGLARFWDTLRARLDKKQDTLTADDTIVLEEGGIGVAVPVRNATRAEYRALTEEEKQADALYLVDEAQWVPVSASIQEYDTDDGWHVRKWSNGFVEAYRIFEIKITGWNIGGDTWYSNPFLMIPPNDMQSVSSYSVNVVQKVGGPFCWIGTDPSEDYSYNLLSNTNRGSFIAYVSAAVTGRWK